MIRREDGFEKRYLWRCGWCRLVVGYELDEIHSPSSGEGGEVMDVDGRGKDGEGGEENGRTKVMYLLPGGIMSTEVMANGKRVGEGEVGLGEEGSTAVAAWE